MADGNLALLISSARIAAATTAWLIVRRLSSARLLGSGGRLSLQFNIVLGLLLGIEEAQPSRSDLVQEFLGKGSVLTDGPLLEIGHLPVGGGIYYVGVRLKQIESQEAVVVRRAGPWEECRAICSRDRT